LHALGLFAGVVLLLGVSPATADTNAQTLPFAQNWTNTGLITVNDDWSGVPGIVGYLGQDITTSTGVDPQTLLTESAVANDVDVIANQTSTAITNGGVAEFHIADPVVALQGSGTADAPSIVLTLDTTGRSNVTIAYDLRDIDGTGDNAVQPVALQYRVGTSGNFTNVPGGFVADATTGPSLATLVTAVNATLPAAVNNQPLVQVRIITSNAVGSDEWVGVDDISVTADSDAAPAVQSTTPSNNGTDVAVAANIGVTFTEPVDVSGNWFTISCATSGLHGASASGGPTSFTLDPTSNFVPGESCTVTVVAAQVTDQDANDPPDAMGADYVFGFTTVAAGATPGDVVVSEVYGGGGNSGATLKNDFIELYNRTGSPISLAGWTVQYASAAGTSWSATALNGTIPPDRNYLVKEAAGAGGTLDLPGPNATGTIAMSATAGKVALVSSTTALAGSCPTGSPIVDFVGYGAANCSETAPTAALNNTTSAQRKDGGTTDTDNNSADFDLLAPDPHGTHPVVTSTTPPAGGSGVALGANVTITFSEPVSVAGDWFSIVCGTSGAHTAAASGGPTTYTLDPTADFAGNESCTVTVVAANVTPNLAADYSFTFQTAEPFVCGDPATPIHTVQGTGTTSPLTGSSAVIEGVVVGDYQAAGEFGGFYVQEEDGQVDADPATSEGIFVFSSTAMNVGDVVRARGIVTEFVTGTSSLTELTSVSVVSVCSTGNTVTPTTVTLPVSAMADFERYEGMRVHFSQTLTATETFTLARFGEVRLAEGGRLYTPTAITTPGAAAIAQQNLNDRRSFVLDDGNNQQNIDPTRVPIGGLSAANTLRSGYTVDNLDGVFDDRFSTYRVQPVGPVPFAATNPRTPAPEAVGGNLKVASFNVLNFFNGDGLGGGFPTSRGANTQFEFDRQKAKEVSALQAMNADIVGLMEMENDAPPNSAIEELVAGLNAAMGAGTYAFIDTGVIGTDEIKVALIYKPARVTPVGAYQIITAGTDPRFIDTKNRPSLAQTFQKNSNGEKLTVVVNHLKSKGSACDDVGDPDTGDGQGNCNLTRANAAAAIVDWLATDPTGSGDPDFLLIGDMNSYTFEDPITTFTNGGFTNLARRFGGLDAYSYVFDGESGYLDHALASASLDAQATGATHWHINADEPIALDYNVEFKTANQVNTFYDPGPYRASDHDPVVIGLTLNTAPTATFNAPASASAGLPFTLSLTNPVDPDTGDTLTYAFDCGNGYGAFSATSSVSCTAPTSLGTISVGGKIRDSERATTEYRATVDVTVTYESLCALTRQYSSRQDVADDLCAELAAAKKAAERNDSSSKQKHLANYTKIVNKQTGKAFTPDEAATLSRLAGKL